MVLASPTCRATGEFVSRLIVLLTLACELASCSSQMQRTYNARTVVPRDVTPNWSRTVPGDAHALVANRDAIVVDTGSGLIAVSAQTGRQLWTDPTLGSPFAISGNIVYA